MATQHPDSASRYVPVQEEVEEAINYFLDGWAEGLNYDEYKVDYEGKLTPYHQVSQIVLRAVEVGLKPG
ncbi:MAG: phosphoenolpyruvate carboxylase, partial [Thermoprotei archaeon]